MFSLIHSMKVKGILQEIVNAEQVEVEMVLMLEINSPSKCFTKERTMQVRPGSFIFH